MTTGCTVSRNIKVLHVKKQRDCGEKRDMGKVNFYIQHIKQVIHVIKPKTPYMGYETADLTHDSNMLQQTQFIWRGH